MNNELVFIWPRELKFPFKLKVPSSCVLELVNNTDNYVAFKVKNTSVKKYAVQPSRGVVPPKVTCNVTVTMEAPKEAPPGMQCKDKFLVQSIIAPSGSTVKDISSDMFKKEPCRLIEEKILSVLYVASPQIPSPIHESPEEGQAQNEDTGYMNRDVLSSIPVLKELSELKEKNFEVLKELNESKAKLFEAQAKLSELTEEKSATFQQKQKLELELALIKSTSHGRVILGFPFLFVCFTGIVGVIMGHCFHL